MGDPESERAERERIFSAFRVDDVLMGQARPDAVFMHCMPAHRGLEVAASVIDGPQSVVFDQAENRLHTATAILHELISGHLHGRVAPPSPVARLTRV
jgi:ornithine carbamoyltransferase